MNELEPIDVLNIQESVNKVEMLIKLGTDTQRVCHEDHTGIYKIYNIVMHTLANKDNHNSYINKIEDNYFKTTICLELSKLQQHESIIS